MEEDTTSYKAVALCAKENAFQRADLQRFLPTVRSLRYGDAITSLSLWSYLDICRNANAKTKNARRTGQNTKVG